MTSPEFASFTQKLLARSRQLTAKDGSQGLETVVSLNQYHRAYDLVKRYVPTQSAVLDWGGGSGHFSMFLHEAGYRTTTFAFGEPQFIKAEIAAQQVKYVPGNTTEPVRLPFPDASFEAVCSIGVLEHVRETGGNERASLEEIKRILKPGGVFICYHFPNKGSWIEYLARRFGSYSHQYIYTRADVDAIFSGVLSIQESRRYALLPRNSLRRLPAWLSNAAIFASVFDLLDKALARLCPALNQNWLVVAKKAST